MLQPRMSIVIIDKVGDEVAVEAKGGVGEWIDGAGDGGITGVVAGRVITIPLQDASMRTAMEEKAIFLNMVHLRFSIVLRNCCIIAPS